MLLHCAVNFEAFQIVGHLHTASFFWMVTNLHGSMLARMLHMRGRVKDMKGMKRAVNKCEQGCCQVSPSVCILQEQAMISHGVHSEMQSFDTRSSVSEVM
jgi:hypothetical protein